jgi:Trypsin-like peptidase domain
VDGLDVISSEPTVPLTETFRHGGLDLAAFVIRTSTIDRDFPTIPVATEATDCDGSDVSVHGHTLAGDAGSGVEAVIPHWVRGRIALTDGESRGFLDTGDEETVMGMCGGPVMNSSGECIGLLEGLVPHLGVNDKLLSSFHAKIGGCSVYIRARELLPFIADVETEWERDGGQRLGK